MKKLTCFPQKSNHLLKLDTIGKVLILPATIEIVERMFGDFYQMIHHRIKDITES